MQLSEIIQSNGSSRHQSAPPVVVASRLLTILVCLTGSSVLLSLLSLAYTWQITQKEFPTLVQMNDGTVAEIDFKDPGYRSPATIQRFVSDTLHYLLNMTDYSSAAQPSGLNPNRERAEGVPVKSGNTQGQITQNAWLAAESLEANLATTFRSKLAEMTSRDVFRGKEEVLLTLDYIQEPELILDSRDRWTGRWSVDVVGNLKVFRLGYNGNVEVIPFNKRITVRPINTLPITDVETFGELTSTINKIRLSGLQIENIEDLAVVEVFQ